MVGLGRGFALWPLPRPLAKEGQFPRVWPLPHLPAAQFFCATGTMSPQTSGGWALGDAPGDCLPGEGPLRDQGQLGSICTLVLSDGAVGLSRKERAEYLSGRRGGWGEGFVRMLQNLKSTQWSKVTFPSLNAQMETGASSMC